MLDSLLDIAQEKKSELDDNDIKHLLLVNLDQDGQAGFYIYMFLMKFISCVTGFVSGGDRHEFDCGGMGYDGVTSKP